MSTKFPKAFSLTELLVSVAVVAVLLGLLLPSLAAVRDHGRRVQCASNAAQIGSAAMMRANDTGGYLPLAGLVRIPDAVTSYGRLPAALNDSRRSRYAYLDHSAAPFGEQLVPLPVALLGYLGSDSSDVEIGGLWDLTSTTTRYPGLGLFECPDVPDGNRLASWVSLRHGGIESLQVISHRWDFVANEAVTGFDHRFPPGSGRSRGLLTSIRNASETVLLGEADRLSIPLDVGYLFNWSPPASVPSAMTLRDVWEGTAAGRQAPLDFHRHRGRANVLFVDGHVETLRLTPGDLERAVLRHAD